MLRDSCQVVSCCRVFCFYHMRCVFSRSVESQHCLQELGVFLSLCCSMCTPKNTTLNVSRRRALFSAGHLDGVQMFKSLKRVTVGIWQLPERGQAKEVFPQEQPHRCSVLFSPSCLSSLAHLCQNLLKTINDSGISQQCFFLF